MNMNKARMLRKQAQAGFTLIELIVVIVILGILAATALPKMASLGGDARVATMKAAQGSILSIVAMTKAKHAIDSTAVSLDFDGTPVTFSATTGVPTIAGGIFTAAGLGDGYTIAGGVVTAVGAKTPASCKITYEDVTGTVTPSLGDC